MQQKGNKKINIIVVRQEEKGGQKQTVDQWQKNLEWSCLHKTHSGLMRKVSMYLLCKEIALVLFSLQILLHCFL
jgi:type III secretory pathway lipoprotein EscJ